MEVKISKELVSAVLQIDIKDISIIGSTLNYTIPNHETEEDGELVYIDLGQNINIYEFAFKCKEWAFNNGYILNYRVNSNPKTFTHMLKIEKIKINDYIKSFDNEDIYYKQEMELIYIIESCEWILKEI